MWACWLWQLWIVLLWKKKLAPCEVHCDGASKCSFTSLTCGLVLFKANRFTTVEWVCLSDTFKFHRFFHQHLQQKSADDWRVFSHWPSLEKRSNQAKVNENTCEQGVCLRLCSKSLPHSLNHYSYVIVNWNLGHLTNHPYMCHYWQV